MATVPLSGTDISIFTGVPFSNDYKNTRWFDTATAQTNYFNSLTKVHQINFANFQRGENGRTHINVNASLDALRSANYLRFRNGHYESKYFYAFVTKLEYINEKMTRVHFHIDVIQTYRFDWTFLPSFVEREHRPLWNADGTPVINTLDEGLDYGADYQTVEVKKVLPNDHKWLVIVCKQVMHDGDDKGKVTPTVVGTVQPLTYYIVPFKDDDTVPDRVILKSNDTTAPFYGPISRPSEVLKGVYTDTDAVNNVVSIFVTDYCGLVANYDDSGVSTEMTFADGYILKRVTLGTDPIYNVIHVEKVKNFGTYSEDLGDKYSGYPSYTESKLYMYPYSILVLDDFKGNRVEIKNEYISGTRSLMDIKGSLGTSNKTSYGFSNYSYGGSAYAVEMSNENALINSDPNDVPIVTDLLSAYLQGNKNQIQTQKDAAIFHGIMGVTGSVVSGVSSAMNPARSVLGGNPMGALSAAVDGVGHVGNSMLQIQALNSKQQDINNMPPQLTKMGSNTAYSAGNRYNGMFVIKKTVKAEYRAKLEQFFNMFGYKTNEVKVPNFHTRENWNYVKTVGCNIKGNFNNEDLNEIKAIFDNGITLWHTDAIGSYGYTNGVI
jgi:hypothetical protein